MHQIPIDSLEPAVADTAWIAPTAVLVGDVSIAPGASVWYGAVLRADGDHITIGDDTNIQDGSVLHADPRLPVTVGRRVSVGHRAVLHGCTVEDDVLVGMGAIVLNEARIGRGSLVAAGTVVLEGTVVPSNSLIAGVPGKIRRQTTEAERAHVSQNAADYTKLADRHRRATR